MTKNYYYAGDAIRAYQRDTGGHFFTAETVCEDCRYMRMSETTFAEQYYVFTGPDGWAWVEMFYGDQHVTAPGPCRSVADQMALLAALHPGATVDELLPEDVADAMRYAA